MRVLIVYASKHGQTERVAMHIADELRACDADTFAFEVSALSPHVMPHAADLVIIASPVYFGKHAKAIERFVLAQRANLDKTRTAFVSVSGSARSAETMPAAEEAVRLFLRTTGWTPGAVAMFAGGEPYTRYGFFTRFIMKRINRDRGRVVDTKRDYDYTDWSAVSRFARELAGAREIVPACSSSSLTSPTSAFG